MGTWVQVVATGRPGPVRSVLQESIEAIDRLERLWSRFQPTSEISLLNATAGAAPVTVHPETALLVQRGVEGWWRTAGRFDPALLRAVVSAGYDRDFASIGADGAPPVEPLVTLPDRLDPGCGAIVVDREASTVFLPAGVGFDPGGLGKGLAADLVAEAGIARPGVDGILVNLGGDLRCLGQPPTEGAGAWVVGLSEDGGRLRLRLGGGAVATSTRLRRRWTTSDGASVHHLIDPTTGRSAAEPARSVSVVAASACDAEILATAVAAAGRLPVDRALLGGAVAVVTRADGEQEVHGPIEEFLA